ncbi:baseplate J/gp47 family protein [Comamonas resistens]|uniref:baseplate assembly protein n=1 Tax=Comamonas resistens TaxID=3046670 RepID=UPI0039BC82A5
MSLIDLSTVPAPQVVEPLNFEAVLIDLKAQLLERYPAAATVIGLESEPLVKLLEVAAEREVMLRQRINEAARAVMLAKAVGTDLDNLGANVETPRLPGESDTRYRQRVQLAFSALAAAGPAAAYRAHALAVALNIDDVQVFSEASGQVTVCVLAWQDVPPEQAQADAIAAGLALFGPADNAALVRVIEPTGGPTMAAVLAALNAEHVRPLTDCVIVRAPRVVPLQIEAELLLRTGPDPDQILARRKTALRQYLQQAQQQGIDVTRAGIIAALVETGVQDVRLASPVDNVVAGPGEICACTGVNVVARVPHG